MGDNEDTREMEYTDFDQFVDQCFSFAARVRTSNTKILLERIVECIVLF